MAMLLLLAAVGGSLMGMMVVVVKHAVLPMWLGLALLIAGLICLGKYWICSPLNQLIRQLDQISRQARPTTIALSLANRNDEIGLLAKGINRCAERDIRHYCEAKNLRSSLDRGVEQATRRATSQLRKMALHDPLTDLGNRRFLDENLERLVDPAQASGTELVCIAIDIDNFKQVNDALGHATGDELLQLLADLIRGHKRQEDYGVRLGGDEFIVLMPGGELNRAEDFAGQITKLFRQHTRIVLPAQVLPDLSIGIACLSEGMINGQQLLEAADQNLYAAKRAGKGCVVVKCA